MPPSMQPQQRHTIYSLLPSLSQVLNVIYQFSMPVLRGFLTLLY